MKLNKTLFIILIASFISSLACFAQQEGYPANYARFPRFKALLFYNRHVEEAHLQFAEQTIDFFRRLTYGDGYILDVTDNFSAYSDKLEEYDVLIAVNDSPVSEKDRAAFEKYMENGGGWIGFHAAAYNDRNTKWPWFNKFLGAGVFYCNNWPPQPALLELDTTDHAVTKNLPEAFVAPASEWYQWDPSPRVNPSVDVLLSLSARNYPIGIKDVIKFGDFPIVWTNRDYRMIYLNMGHGDVEYLDATQNLLFVNAFRWIVSLDPKGNPFDK